jgi:hypothetical protein
VGADRPAEKARGQDRAENSRLRDGVEDRADERDRSERGRGALREAGRCELGLRALAREEDLRRVGEEGQRRQRAEDLARPLTSDWVRIGKRHVVLIVGCVDRCAASSIENRARRSSYPAMRCFDHDAVSA